MNKHAIILAAGKGTRMHTELPKCAVNILGKPMIEHVYEACKNAGIDDIIVVVGYKKEYIIDILKDKVRYVEQKEQLGTGHACMMAKSLLENEEGCTIILPGDMPLVGSENIMKLLNYHVESNNQMTILSTILDNPFSYGRIKRNEFGNVTSIVEEKEATEEEKTIKEVNSGLYVVDNKLLFQYLNQINKLNSKNEYYLTDIVSIMGKKYKIDALNINNDYRLTGINNMETLNDLKKIVERSK